MGLWEEMVRGFGCVCVGAACTREREKDDAAPRLHADAATPAALSCTGWMVADWRWGVVERRRGCVPARALHCLLGFASVIAEERDDLRWEREEEDIQAGTAVPSTSAAACTGLPPPPALFEIRCLFTCSQSHPFSGFYYIIKNPLFRFFLGACFFKDYDYIFIIFF